MQNRSRFAALVAAFALVTVAASCTQPPMDPGPPPVKAVAAAGRCALLETGDVRCWGQNYGGYVGNGSSGWERGPTTARLGQAATSITSGWNQCAVLADTTVKCWGSGYVGNGTTGVQELPQTVTGLSGVAKVRALGNHTCAVLTSGGVRCWGRNSGRELGDGTTTDRTTPVTVTGLTGVADVVRSGDGSCALLTNATVRCWGPHLFRTSSGSLGLTTVSALAGATALAGGSGNVCAIVAGGTVKCFGSGLLGDGKTTALTSPATGVTATGITGATSIGTDGYNTICAVVAGGAVKCWGDNAFGKVLGTGDSMGGDPVAVPTAVAGVSGATQIAPDSVSTCAVLASGWVTCWGSNEYSGLSRSYPGPQPGYVEHLYDPSPYTNTSTAWPAGQCFAADNQPWSRDIRFTGAVDTLDNVTSYSSRDGSCTGDAWKFTMVQRDMAHEAVAPCIALNPNEFNWAIWAPDSYPKIPLNLFSCYLDLEL